MACTESILAWKPPCSTKIPWFYEFASLVNTAHVGWQCAVPGWYGSEASLPPCLTLSFAEYKERFKRWVWKWIFVRIRNKSLQGTNNIKMLQTVRNRSNSSCWDVHNEHSMWAAIKNTGGKSVSMKNNLKKKNENPQRAQMPHVQRVTTTEMSLGPRERIRGIRLKFESQSKFCQALPISWCPQIPSVKPKVFLLLSTPKLHGQSYHVHSNMT